MGAFHGHRRHQHEQSGAVSAVEGLQGDRFRYQGEQEYRAPARAGGGDRPAPGTGKHRGRHRLLRQHRSGPSGQPGIRRRGPKGHPDPQPCRTPRPDDGTLSGKLRGFRHARQDHDHLDDRHDPAAGRPGPYRLLRRHAGGHRRKPAHRQLQALPV